MNNFTIAIYCFCDDFCKLTREKPDLKRQLNDVQLISIVIIARLF